MRFFAFLLASACLLPSVAEASEQSNTQRVRYTNLTALRINPLGLQNQFELDYQLQLFEPGDSILLKGNYLGATAVAVLSPASSRVGAAVKFRPLALLKLEARFEHIAYFGNFGHVSSFESPRDDYSDTAIDVGEEAGANASQSGWNLTLDAEIRAKIGPMVVRNRFKANYIEMSVKDGDTVWYEPYWDMMLPSSGWYLLNDADLLFYVTDQLIIGARYSLTSVTYDASDYRPGERRNNINSPDHRLGPLVAYTFWDDPEATFNRPTVVLILNWYLKQRFRTGADVSQAMPYIVLGFAFRGDLLEF